MTPQVSVVVKAYNHAAYVRETIQSILDQSFQDYEIVVTATRRLTAPPMSFASFQIRASI
jgi:cellulose synthase/poly-beta-1,6-N-acetylglucosamine synthase-like glycosyltransferase